MSDFNEQTQQADMGRTVSLSARARATLKMATGVTIGAIDLPLFETDTEAIRFACLLGLRYHGDTMPPLADGRDANAQTVINVGTLDTSAPSFISTVKLLAPDTVQKERLTRIVRAHAEWGLAQIQKWIEEAELEGDDLDLAHLVKKGEALLDGAEESV
ncbi:MAG: hypothetical protein L0I84_01940 [Halomonas subglaciescola]|nr:hypothetical protein [Halomonas subglaciescola]